MGTSVELDTFRNECRKWLAANMQRWQSGDKTGDDGDAIALARVLQRRLYDGGYGGLCFPVEYGGRGLAPEFQRVFNEESVGYLMPQAFAIPTLSIIGATILDCGSEDQKMRFLPPMFNGDALWVQMLSEPHGGSDMASVRMRATRDGDAWILNGSKIWTSGALWADMAVCLARTDWQVPKHAGLTMFLLDLKSDGLDMVPIEMIDGSLHFCQEFVDDVVVSDDAVLGEVNAGWSVATRLLHHERLAVAGASQFANTYLRKSSNVSAGQPDLFELARRNDVLDDPVVRQRIGRAEVLAVVQDLMRQRMSLATETGELKGPVGSILRLLGGLADVERAAIRFELAADEAVVSEDSVAAGIAYVQRQASCMGGGTTEMARNLIAERILQMPREAQPDKGIPFADVPQGRR